MKICGNCGKEYEEHEQKCPVCGSTVLKYDNHNKADEEYQRIQKEILRKRRSRSILLGVIALALVLVVIFAAKGIIRHLNDPQRAIDKAASEQYETAMDYINSGDYDKALSMLEGIDSSWSDYSKVEGAKATAVKAQVKEKLSVYEADGDYESIISYIDENVENVDSDAELKKLYDESVSKYKQAALKKVDDYVKKQDYSAASSVLTTAIRVIGSDKDLESKLSAVQKQDILAQVKKHQADSDYAAAIKLVNDNMDKVGNDSDILLALSSCEDAYRKEVTANAEKAFQDSGYEQALSIVEQGLKVLKDDGELKKLQTHYKGYKPENLLEREIYTMHDGAEYDFADKMEDSKGYIHNNCYEILCHPDGRYFYRWDLDGQYTVLKGHLYARSDGTYWLEVYDGENLLYTTEHFSYECAFEYDITNVKYLTLKLYRDYSGNPWLIVDSMDIYSY